jgi:anaerobic selenocysteine-containing dehydrogenase
MSNSAAWRVDAEAVIGVPAPNTRVVNMNRLGRALTEFDAPPVKVLFVYNCNPVATVPDQNRVRLGMAREDLFTVVFEQVMTDSANARTCAAGDPFLDITTSRRGAPITPAVQPVIAPVGEARPTGVFRAARARAQPA